MTNATHKCRHPGCEAETGPAAPFCGSDHGGAEAPQSAMDVDALAWRIARTLWVKDLASFLSGKQDRIIAVIAKVLRAHLAQSAPGVVEALKAIRDYEPKEVAIDEFSYNRMVKNYRDAARQGLAAHRQAQEADAASKS